MKRTLLIWVLSLSTVFTAQAKIIVVSDIDDTIRQSNVVNLVDAFTRLFTTPLAFEGLKHLYQDLKRQSLQKSSEFEVCYISASYPVFYNAEEWVKLKGFPQGLVVQRRVGENKKTFKKKHIKAFLQEKMNRDDTVLFFGDNAEIDLEIYSEIVKELAIEDSNIYIRDVRMEVSMYAPIKKVIPNVAKNVKFFAADYELLSLKRFSKVDQKSKKAIYAQVMNGTHLPGYMLARIKTPLEKHCANRPTVKYCQGDNHLRKFVEHVELDLLTNSL